MTLIRIHPNMGEQYLKNLILVTEHPNLASFDATDEWRQKIARIGERVEAMISEEETDRITSTIYPEVRTILSDKPVREIRFTDQPQARRRPSREGAAGSLPHPRPSRRPSPAVPRVGKRCRGATRARRAW